MDKKYIFKSYSNAFPQLFEAEKKRIAPHLKHSIAIEHVGSTAVPHLGGKGIVDIAIAVEKEDMDRTSKELQKLGYEFRPSFSTVDRLYFVIYLIDPEEGTRRYHVHLTHLKSEDWKGLIGFRDYLRKHPDEAKEYGEMKKRAALEADNEGKRYRNSKSQCSKNTRLGC